MGLTNMAWKIGDVTPLPFPERPFLPSSPATRSTTFWNPKLC